MCFIEILGNLVKVESFLYLKKVLGDNNFDVCCFVVELIGFVGIDEVKVIL